MWTDNYQPGQWLTDADLFEIADSLLFEIRFNERLEFIYNAHVQVNGIRIFDAFIVRFEQVKRELDKPLKEEMKGWNEYIIGEKAEGRTPDLDGIPTLTELRKDQGYPTATLFPQHWRKMTHISWIYVEEKKLEVSEFKIQKQLNNLAFEMSKIPEILKSENSSNNAQIIEEGEKPEYHYKSFNDLFRNQTDIKPCLDILNNYEKGRNRKGLLKKSVVVAWTDHLYSISKIHTNEHRLLAPVLESEFDGWSVSRSTWYEPGTGYEDAKKYFTLNILR